MIDDLIEYYQRELSFLRNNAGAFAEAHPKIASRLRLTRESVEDPHIGRLIEAVAFLNARLRHKIDDEYSDLSDALLLTLYPHLIQPLPSLMVVRLEPEVELDKPTRISAGRILLSEEVDGEPCRYTLCHDVQLMPIRLSGAAMGGPPFDAPALGMGQAKGLLRLTFTATKPDIELDKLGLDSLRLFIKSDARRAQILIEQLGANLLGIGVASSPADPRAVLLPPDALRLLGLEESELLLPHNKVARSAYALVQEHFAYPQKHLFFEIGGLDARTLDLSGQQLELFLYFDRLSPELERVVRPDDFELFACPAINLFETEAEPIHLDHSSVEYRVIPDARREDAIEVYAVEQVSLQDASGTRIDAPPLYSVDRGSPRLGRMFHAVSRRSSFGPGGGDDVFLTVADLDGRLLRDDATVVNARLLATNRDLPARLPFGGGRPDLSVSGTVPGLKGASALTKPSPTRRPGRRRSANWKLIGQLSLNHLSLVGEAAGGQALREMLALYDVGDTTESGHLRDRLVGVSARPGVARLRINGHAAMCAGIDAVLEIDDERLSGSGSFLLCAAIERFLAGACAMNSFVRVSAKLQRESGVWKTWPARIGDRPLI
ncbi:type VI secretion system baseplate subunit TssF [Sphingomonas sp. MAH-20]|uniref:Type VI secretion system baseplate subunit TssF n=1 Tax=Sphingomonas horti TaxID=2682842 RepID=A0A6I4IX78_9SPHN|nr:MULTISPECIES: type VI secretion system baseplate subunit TssF [Sphingomonas]MBA2920548.1 type VI secretion system baseplate subunit TssF [Sphingomonas sp. CGMCC 1.13658]MVO76800.1 type VI secretion system baseplate subunit TssF [Sphingomonas horti]